KGLFVGEQLVETVRRDLVIAALIRVFIDVGIDGGRRLRDHSSAAHSLTALFSTGGYEFSNVSVHVFESACGKQARPPLDHRTTRSWTFFSPGASATGTAAGTRPDKNAGSYCSS